MIFCMFSCSVVRTRSCHTVIECLSKNIFLTNSVSSAFSVIYASVSLYFVNCLHLDLEKQIFPLSTSHQYAYWMKLRCKTQKKQPWEKSNYCRNFSETRCTRGVGGGDLEVWSRIMNDPRRTNSRGCADSLRDDRLGHDGCCRDQTCETPRCRLVLSTSRVKRFVQSRSFRFSSQTFITRHSSQQR